MLVHEAKIIVCCSKGVSGGPELLHQLVHELRANGREAYIAYYPFNISFSCPEAYKRYDAPQAQLSDEYGTFVVVPETATWIAKYVKKARVGIWWLSVDNYFLASHNSVIKDLYFRYKSLVRARLPIFRLRNLLHFSQSHYAEKFLQDYSIPSHQLTDYLSEAHFSNRYLGDGHAKENVVAFNPLKGYKKTKLLVSAYPEIIDFGHHPGKDRPPREAAMAGCCVITGRSGSARYHQDLPILEKYKLDDTTNSYVNGFGMLADSIFKDFSVYVREFDDYRLKISNEPQVFKQQVRAIFG